MELFHLKYLKLFILLVVVPPCFTFYRQQEVNIQTALIYAKWLPQSIISQHYKLKLKPLFNYGQFTGTVEIEVACHSSTNTIKLHAYKTLNINNNEITVK